MKRTKKLLAILLCMTMCLSLLPVWASADDGDGEGTTTQWQLSETDLQTAIADFASATDVYEGDTQIGPSDATSRSYRLVPEKSGSYTIEWIMGFDYAAGYTPESLDPNGIMLILDENGQVLFSWAVEAENGGPSAFDLTLSAGEAYNIWLKGSLFPNSKLKIVRNITDAEKFETAITSALPLALGQHATANIENPGDIAVFSFTPELAGDYRITSDTIDPLGFDTIFPEITVYDSNGTAVNNVKYELENPSNSILYAFSATAGETYYMAAAMTWNSGARTASFDVAFNKDNHLSAGVLRDDGEYGYQYAHVSGEELTLRVQATADDMTGITYEWIPMITTVNDYGEARITGKGDSYDETSDTLVLAADDMSRYICCVVRDAYGASSTVMYAIEPSQNILAELEAADQIYLDNMQPVIIATGGEVVYFKFIPEMDGTYNFQSFETDGTYIDTYGYLYDSEGNEINSDDDSAGDGYFLISTSLSAGTVYYLGAKFYSTEQTGSFEVKISLDTSLQDRLAAFETASEIALGERKTASVTSSNDYVYFAFTAPADDTYALYSDIDETINSYFYTSASAYDEDGTRIGLSQDFNPRLISGGGNFWLSFDAQAGKTYYLEVSGTLITNSGASGLEIPVVMTLDNHLEVTAAGETTSVNQELGQPVTLGVNVTADDMTGITYTWRAYPYEYWFFFLGLDEDPAVLDSNADTIVLPGDNPYGQIACTVADQYGFNKTITYTINRTRTMTGVGSFEAGAGSLYLNFTPEESGTYLLKTTPQGEYVGNKLIVSDSGGNSTESETGYLNMVMELEAGVENSLFIMQQGPVGRFNISVETTAAQSCGENLTWSFDESTGTLAISGTGAMFDYSSNNGTTTAPWRQYVMDGSLTSLVVGEGVTSLGAYAFEGAANLQSVSLPSTLTYMATNVIYKTGITSATYNGTIDGLLQVNFNGNQRSEAEQDGYMIQCLDGTVNLWHWSGDRVFYDVDVDNLTMTFYGTGEIKNYNVEDGNDRPWYIYREYITRVVIGEGITAIGNDSFAEFTSLTEIVLPDTVTSIGENAFANTVNLQSIALPAGLTHLGAYAFYGSGITSIALPEGLTTLGDGTFMGCTNLQEITIPVSVTEIGEGAFAGCTGFADVHYNASVLDRGSISIAEGNDLLLNAVWHYAQDDGIVYLPNSLTTIGADAFQNASFVYVVVPDTTQEIGDRAFMNCGQMIEIVIPDTVTTFGKNVFAGCGNLTIVCSAGSDAYNYATANGIAVRIR